MTDTPTPVSRYLSDDLSDLDIESARPVREWLQGRPRKLASKLVGTRPSAAPPIGAGIVLALQQ
ncbi:hypothetical protein AB0E10_38125 [Streptomyces sp. NPDC048045]|uniref:hypothetical protein n=1 Tax=Streptomyces sp. NPDC048045 TaxID=3154710 RepID=UPI00341A0374